MKIRVISSKDEIKTLDSNEEMVHLAFRPSNKDILVLVQKCPDLKGIHVPSSYNKTISTTTRMLLEMRSIALIEGDVWGHRKDINEYYEVKPRVFDRIDELKNEEKSREEIISRLAMETHLSKDLIAFLI